MRHAVSASAGTLLTAAVLASFLQTNCIAAASEEPSIGGAPKGSDEPSSQMDKRDWNKQLNMWGKRSWESQHGGWGLKREQAAAAPWPGQYYYNYNPTSEEKRAWQNLQGGWGKRYAPEDEYAIQQLASLLEKEDHQQQPQYSDYGPETAELLEPNDEEKRSWKKFNQGWGKRADTWNNFRGSWGKRDPAWTNLKGIWGKRSSIYPDRSPQ